MGRLVVRRFQGSDTAAIARLNGRLQGEGFPYTVYAEDEPNENGGARPGGLRERLFVAAEGDEIRGAVWLREQPFRVGEREMTLGWAKYPVAESSIDPRYRGVPAGLVRQLLREQPRLMALGLGGHSGTFARLLAGMGWSGTTIPLQIHVVRPRRVLRRIPHLRGGPVRNLLMDLLAQTGLGWVGYRAYEWLKVGRRQTYPDYAAREVPRFGAWVDDTWSRCCEQYGFLAVRDASTLNRVFPQSFRGISRLRVLHRGREAGWISTVRVDMSSAWDNRDFGDLVVGLLADGLASPKDAAGVLASGCRHLLDTGVDLIFSNQAHPAWRDGLRSLGFIDGPSNFAFYRSPQAAALFEDPTVRSLGCHINRGDCDRPRLG